MRSDGARGRLGRLPGMIPALRTFRVRPLLPDETGCPTL